MSIWSILRPAYRAMTKSQVAMVAAVPLAIGFIAGGAAFAGLRSPAETVVDRSETQRLERLLSESKDELDTVSRQLATRQFPKTRWRTKTVTVFVPGTQVPSSVSVTTSGSRDEGSESTSSVSSSSSTHEDRSVASVDSVSRASHESVRQRGPLVFAGLGIAPLQTSLGPMVLVGTSVPVVWRLEVGVSIVVPTENLTGTTPFLTVGLRL